MNAHKFVAEKGVDEAKGIISNIPAKYMECYYSTLCWCTKTKKYSDRFKPRISLVNIADLIRVVESVEVVNKFDSVQQAVDAIKNAPYGSTDYRKLSCSTRYIKQSERFFEWWDGGNWRRPTAPFTDENNILRFTELSNLEKSVADYELVESYKQVKCEFLDMVDVSPRCEVINETH